MAWPRLNPGITVHMNYILPLHRHVFVFKLVVLCFVIALTGNEI
jgi:hypothetical protein